MRSVSHAALLLAVGFCAGTAAAQFEKAKDAVAVVEVLDENWVLSRKIMDRKISQRERDAELGRVRIKQPFRLLVSGVAVAPNEIVVPALHPTAPLHIMVRFRDGKTVKAQVVGNDPRSNLALLRTPSSAPAHLTTANKHVVDDQWIALIGHRTLTPAVGRGVVTHPRLGVRTRDIYGVRNGRSLAIGTAFFAATNTRVINPGSACLDEKGQLAGVVLGCAPTMAMPGARPGLNGTFVLPGDRVAKILKCLREHGKVRRADFGMSVMAVPEAMLAHFPELPPGAGNVVRVAKNGPAAKAGVRVNDVVIAINDRKPRDIHALREAMCDCTSKKGTKISVLRAGETMSFDVTPAVEPTR